MRCGIAELIAGLTILCSGDKSEKLSVAFDAFDVGRKGKEGVLPVLLQCTLTVCQDKVQCA